MRNGIAAILVCVFLMLAATPVFSHDYDRNDSDYWLRIAAYVAYPVGFVAEWAITRPIHWVVSRPGLNHFFGHQSCPDDKYWQLEKSCIREHVDTTDAGLYEVTPVTDEDVAASAAPVAPGEAVAPAVCAGLAPVPQPAGAETKPECPAEKPVSKEVCPPAPTETKCCK